MFDRLQKIVTTMSQTINGVGGGILLVLMFLTAFDVILRYLFNKPISGSFELTEFMMVCIVGLGLAYCGVNRGHVGVELILERVSPKTRAIMNAITYGISLIFVALITWQLIKYIGTTYEAHLTSSVLLIPNFPFVAILSIGVIAFTLVFLVQVIEFILQACKK